MAHQTYIRETQSSEVVLFIHGFLGSPEHFKDFILSLPSSYSVYNILLDGHGAGVRDFGRASMAKWQSQVEEVFSQLCSRYENIYIVGHSMGTFFAMDCALRCPQKVKGLFLLQSPLKIGVKPAAFVRTFKSFFNLFGEDEVALAYKNAHSIKLTFRIWEYIGWIPRYLELFKKSRLSRDTIKALEVPCLIFQSKKDELVSLKSVRFVPQKDNIKLDILENSAHFIYDKGDFLYLIECFKKMTGVN